jgi:SAM-dependent methyltransferase
MLEVARRISPQLDLRLGDACALPFADGEFDVVTCGLSISHFADRGNALEEVRRVLRQRGKFVASAWADGSSIPTRVLSPILDRYAAAVESLDEETWSAGSKGADVLRKAGFTNVSVKTESFRGEFTDPEDALAWATAWPLTAARTARLDPSRQQQFFCEARAALTATSLSWSFAFNFYVAHRPAT